MGHKRTSHANSHHFRIALFTVFRIKLHERVLSSNGGDSDSRQKRHAKKRTPDLDSPRDCLTVSTCRNPISLVVGVRKCTIGQLGVFPYDGTCGNAWVLMTGAVFWWTNYSNEIRQLSENLSSSVESKQADIWGQRRREHYSSPTSAAESSFPRWSVSSDSSIHDDGETLFGISLVIDR